MLYMLDCWISRELQNFLGPFSCNSFSKKQFSLLCQYVLSDYNWHVDLLLGLRYWRLKHQHHLLQCMFQYLHYEMPFLGAWFFKICLRTLPEEQWVRYRHHILFQVKFDSIVVARCLFYFCYSWSNHKNDCNFFAAVLLNEIDTCSTNICKWSMLWANNTMNQVTTVCGILCSRFMNLSFSIAEHFKQSRFFYLSH